MKIGIMTWFSYYNYGTALQVSALHRYLTRKGNDVDVINYIPQRKGDSDIHSYKILDYIKMKLDGRKKEMYPYFEPYESDDRSALFLEYLEKRVTLSHSANTMSELQNLNSEYQAFVSGSDQIWAPTIFDPHYFLDFVTDNEKLIAYAPSMGLPEIKDRFVKSAMKELIDRFHHLSIREEQGKEIIWQLTNKESQVVVDPTLLISADEWTEWISAIDEAPAEPYILVYLLGYEEEHWEQINKISEKKQLRIKVIPTFVNDLEREGCISSAVGPEEFLRLIKGADYICTDSFHGTIFSMIFKKPFSVFERFQKGSRTSQNSRIYHLLKKAGLENRLIEYHGEYSEPEIINYDQVQSALDEEIKKSKKFLDNSLQIVEKHKNTQARHVMEDHTVCCGCGACAYICHNNAIAINMGKKGFWEAVVDEDKCVRCGKCKEICVFEGDNEVVDIASADLYSYKDGRKRILMTSSSGGFAYAVSECLIQKGYTVFGCLFDQSEKRAKHCFVKDIAELTKLQGSKYVQSSFSEVFRSAEALDTPIAVIGTPCQIASAKKVFGDRKKTVFIDLICHGVPTYFLLDSYYDYIEKKYSLARGDMNITFRTKEKGWRELHICITDKNQELIISQKDDLFFRTFETMNCYMDSCYECRWRDASVADLRMGDYWGPRFKEDETGVSMVACFTEKGNELLHDLKGRGSGDLIKQPIDDMLQYQQTTNYPKPLYHDELIRQLSEKKDLRFIVDKYTAPFEYSNKSKRERIQRVLRLLADENIRRIH